MATWLQRIPAAHRARDLNRLKEDVRFLRRFVDGFTVADGFDLRGLTTFSAKQINKIKKAAAPLKQVYVTPHVVVRPRSVQSKRALAQHTGQRSKSQRNFIVPVPAIEGTKVEVKRYSKTVKKKDKSGRTRKTTKITPRVQVERTAGTVKVRDRFYYLPRKPDSFDDIVDMVTEMLPEMPDGFYVMINSNHGMIGESTKKSRIIDDLNHFWRIYDMAGVNTGLAGTVLGYRYVSDNLQGARELTVQRRTQRELWRDALQTMREHKKKKRKQTKAKKHK